MKVRLDGKEFECTELEIVGYYPTQFENGKIYIFVQGMICTKAKLDFRQPTEKEKELEGNKK